MSFVLTALVALASAASTSGPPLLRGFPVYPPEAIAAVPPDAANLPVKLRHLAEALKHPTSRRSGLGAVDREWPEARAYLRTNAEAAGWTFLASDPYTDGGSELETFARLGGGHLDVVRVFFHAGAGTRVDAKGVLWTSPGWGTLDYVFQSIPTSVTYRGFPLLGATELPPVKQTPRGEHLELRDDLRPRLPLWRALPLFGWQPISNSCGRLMEDAYALHGQVILVGERTVPGDVTFLPPGTDSLCSTQRPSK